jgi:hypothetical protein
VLLDGKAVHILSVGGERRFHRIGPVTLMPGTHELTFHPEEPPTIANDVARNGDTRALSFAFGTWRWTEAAP